MYKYIILISSFMLFSCGGGGGGGGGADAPVSIAGKTYRFTINQGAAPLQTGQNYQVAISASAATYVLTGNNSGMSNSTGSYAYLAGAQFASFDPDDSVLGIGSCSLEFSSATSGSYDCAYLQNSNYNHSGSFSEM